MKRFLLAGAMIAALPACAMAQDQAPVTVTPVARLTQTIAGGPIALPQKDVEVIVSTYEIAPGAVLPEHKHRYQRYAYVLAGT